MSIGLQTARVSVEFPVPVSDIVDLLVSSVEVVLREFAPEGRSCPGLLSDGLQGLAPFGAIAGIALAPLTRASRDCCSAWSSELH